MSTAQIDLWKLLLASGLVTVPEYEQLTAIYRRLHGSDAEHHAELATWLVDVGAISPYQAKVLLAGRAGPFVYGDFKVYDRIESGRLAGIFKALHRGANRGVLMHFFSGPIVREAARWHAASEQIERATSLKHPQLCRVYKLVDQQSYKFVILENLMGQPASSLELSDMLKGDACRIVLEAARGLAHLDAQGYVHGDIRPANIWITTDDKVKLLHYPLSPYALDARPLESLAWPVVQNMEDYFSESGSVTRLRATADYFAPELAMPGQAPNSLCDIYALGCSLYELLAGSPPFDDGSAAAKITRHATEPIKPVETFGAPPELNRVIGYMMAKKAELRFQNMAAVIRALEPFAAAALSIHIDVPETSAYELAVRQGRDPVSVALERAQELLANVPATKPQVDRGTAEDGTQKGDQLDMSAIGGAKRATRSQAPSEFWHSSPPAGAKNRNTLPVAAACLVLAVVVGGAAWFALRPSRESAREKAKFSEPSTAKAATGNASTSTSTRQTGLNPTAPAKPAVSQLPAAKQRTPANPAQLNVREIPDDNQTLWVSPTAGPPIDAGHLPPGAQVVLVLRTAELAGNDEGAKMLAALGPAAESAIKSIESAAGVQLAEMQGLTIGVYSAEPQSAETAFVVTLNEPAAVENLRKAWGNPAEVGNERAYLQGGSHSYWLLNGDQTKTFVVGNADQIKELAAAKEPTSLRRDLEALRLTADATRQITLLVPRSYLMGEGKLVLDKINLKLAPAILDFLGDDVQAVALSAHLGENLFVELRALPTSESNAKEVADRLTEKIAALPQQVEDYLAGTNLEPYGRAVLIRFPRMLAELAAYTRTAVEQRQAVSRCYLPPAAGHNLILGTELAIWQSPSTAVGPTAATPSQAVNAVQAALGKSTSLSFPKDTLEHSLETLAGDIGLEIQILGKDLQLDGITRNQSFALDERDKPAGEILRTILKKASPDGKLVYVVKPSSTGGKDAIFITTRTAAQKRGDKIPAELMQPPAGK